MSNFASSWRRWINRFNSEGRDCGTLPVRRTEIGPSNRVNTGRLRPLSRENDKSIKSRAISLFEAVTLRDGDTGKGWVTKSLYTDEFCRVVTSSFDAGIQAPSTNWKKPGQLVSYRFIPCCHCPCRSHISTSTVKCNTFPNMRVRGKDIFSELDQIVAHFRWIMIWLR